MVDGGRTLSLCLADTDCLVDGAALCSKAMRAREQGGSMVVSLVELDSSTERFEDAGLGEFGVASDAESEHINQIQDRLCAATDAFRWGQTAAPRQASKEPLRCIAELLSSARGVPRITGVLGVGTAVPELTGFVLERIASIGPAALEQDLQPKNSRYQRECVVNFMDTRRTNSIDAIDGPGAELLAWILERYLDTLLACAAEIAHYAGDAARVALQQPGSAALPHVLPKDIRLAQRLLGEGIAPY